MPLRVALFIDGSNVYGGARDAFHDQGAPARDGRTSPRLIGDLLCARRPGGGSRAERTLQTIRVHVGSAQPGSAGYHIQRRQHERWESDGVEVVVRDPGWDAASGVTRESGVDVALALDCFHGALQQAFDVVIIFSEDRDFDPLIERLLNLNRECSVEVAHWWNRDIHPDRKKMSYLGRGMPRVRHHFLTRDDYESVQM